MEKKEEMGTGEPLWIPFPDCVADDAGTAFVAGAAGGTVTHFFRGLRDSPCGHHLAGAPRVAARWAGRLGFYSACSALTWATDRKEDPLISVAAGAATGAIVRLRHGPLAAGRTAFVGAATVAFVHMFAFGDRVDDDKASRNHPPLPEMKNDAIPDASPVLNLWMPPAMPIAVEKVLVADAAASRGSARFRG